MPDDYDFEGGDRPTKVKILTPAEREELERTCARQAKEARRSDNIALVILSPAIIGCVMFGGYLAREILRDIYKHFKGRDCDDKYKH